MTCKKTRWGLMALIIAFAGGGSLVQAAEKADAFSATETEHYTDAVKVWQNLAEQGDAQAQFNLGLMYHGGLGLPRDEAAAVVWYQKAAESGYYQAQIYLTVGYKEGWFGLPKDPGKAYYWEGMIGSTN